MNSKGQGTVEYVLLLIVTISLVLIAAKNLFKPFNEWAGHYIGDYIYCLIDQGELPNLGGEETISECDKMFEKFTAQNGRPKKSDSSSSDEDKKKKEGASAASASAGGRGGRRGGGGAGRLIGSDRGADGPSSKAEKKVDLGESQDSRFYRVRVVNLGSSQGPKKQEVTGISGYLASELEKKKKKQEKTQKVAEVDEDSAQRSRKKMIVTAPKRRVAAEMSEDEPWNFGKLFRVAIIIMIIVAIILFLGSQILQITKSAEK